MNIKWKDEYSVGVKEIDDQHKYFIQLLNDLFNAVSGNKGKPELQELFKRLAEYAEKHFATEEKYFDEFGFEGAAEHKLKHQEMREEIARIQSQGEKSGIHFYGSIVYFLQEWLDEHLVKMDHEYMKCFASHGLK